MDEMPLWARFIPLALVLLALLSVPFMCRSDAEPAAAPVSASPSLPSSSASAERFRPPKDGLLTNDQVSMFISVRERARAERDARLARGASAASVDRDVVDELGFNYDEYKWVKARVDEVRRLDFSTGKANRVEANFATLHRSRAELKAVGVVLPDTQELTRAAYEQKRETVEWQPPGEPYDARYEPEPYEQPLPRPPAWETDAIEAQRQQENARRQLEEWQRRQP